MAFKENIEKTEKWCKNSNFQLIQANESESKLVLRNRDVNSVTFWVITSDTNSKDWSIWSDNDEVCANLSDAIELVSSGRPLNVVDILEKVKKCLKPLYGAAACSDDDDDDDDDDGFEEDEAFEDGYYEDEDMDAMQDSTTKLDESDDEVDKFFTGGGSTTAVHRLIKDMKSIKASEGKFGVHGEPNGDNLFCWDVKLTNFPTDTPLGQDLVDFAKKYKREPVVYIEMKFPKEYPMAPPFVRVVRPRFKFLTGHVTVGGSICMEMLTRSGWRPTNDIESILVQIRAEIMSDKSSRLDTRNVDNPYGEAEAKQAFERMVMKYGWNK